jgi:malate dehydrogenase (oxaloacetate-decarboxylating)
MGVTWLLQEAGAVHITMLDSKGIIARGRDGMNSYKETLADKINPERKLGTLSDALKDADVFIGLSQPNLVSAKMIRSMNDQAIIFAMANPIPEVMPDVAKEGGAFIIATGRSDFPNQVNNVLAFPGLFKGVLDGRIRKFTPTMRVAAAHAIANLVSEPSTEKILPTPFEPGIADAVAKAVRSGE